MITASTLLKQRLIPTGSFGFARTYRNRMQEVERESKFDLTAYTWKPDRFRYNNGPEFAEDFVDRKLPGI